MDTLAWNEIRCDLGVICEWREHDGAYLVRDNDGTERIVYVLPTELY